MQETRLFLPFLFIYSFYTLQVHKTRKPDLESLRPVTLALGLWPRANTTGLLLITYNTGQPRYNNRKEIGYILSVERFTGRKALYIIKKGRRQRSKVMSLLSLKMSFVDIMSI